MISRILYEAAGEPEWAPESEMGTAEGECRTCGQQGTGLSFQKWVRPTFTDHDLLYPGEIVCRACLFCMQEMTEWMRVRTGRDKPQRFRTYSHFVAGGVWHVLTKADKAAMRDLLMQDPEVALIAESGQKHVVLYARPGYWQFELHQIKPNPEELARLLAAVDELYSRGAGKAEILNGRYSPAAVYRVGASAWRSLEESIRPQRGSALFELAVFLSSKIEINDEPEPTAKPQLGLFA